MDTLGLGCLVGGSLLEHKGFQLAHSTFGLLNVLAVLVNERGRADDVVLGILLLPPLFNSIGHVHRIDGDLARVGIFDAFNAAVHDPFYGSVSLAPSFSPVAPVFFVPGRAPALGLFIS